MSRNLLIAALLSLLTVGWAHALTDDHSQPITLKAERLEINQKRGMSRYEGEVELEQGSLHISADRVVVYHKNNEVTRIEADGEPAEIRQRPAPDKEEIRAEARHIDYDLKTATLQLTGQAHIWQDGNEFSGETISFDSQRSVVRASGDEQKKERVEVILQPRKETTP